jgi:hypothetical protein
LFHTTNNIGGLPEGYACIQINQDINPVPGHLLQGLDKVPKDQPLGCIILGQVSRPEKWRFGPILPCDFPNLRVIR